MDEVNGCVGKEEWIIRDVHCTPQFSYAPSPLLTICQPPRGKSCVVVERDVHNACVREKEGGRRSRRPLW